MKRCGKNSILLENVYLLSSATSSGPREKQGPIGEYIDKSYDNLNCLEKTWEEAESTLQKDAIYLALKKADVEPQQIRFLCAGGLLGQCMASSFGVASFQIPLLGLYGACSTCGEGLLVASLLIRIS